MSTFESQLLPGMLVWFCHKFLNKSIKLNPSEAKGDSEAVLEVPTEYVYWLNDIEQDGMYQQETKYIL